MRTSFKAKLLARMSPSLVSEKVECARNLVVEPRFPSTTRAIGARCIRIIASARLARSARRERKTSVNFRPYVGTLVERFGLIPAHSRQAFGFELPEKFDMNPKKSLLRAHEQCEKFDMRASLTAS